MTDNWRATYSERFLDRAIQRPRPEPVQRPLTDEEMALLPAWQQQMALTRRAWSEALAKAGESLRLAMSASVPPRSDT